MKPCLYSFPGGSPEGANPDSAIVLDASGNLYGVTYSGGGGSCNGLCGVVYELNPSGLETVLYRFTGGSDGGVPDGNCDGRRR